MVEARKISFHVLDEWYECRRVSQDVYLVYGGIWVRQHGQGESTLIEMDTRFSVVYRRKNETYEIVHIHHSIPYIDQQYGEYYPKTKEAMSLAKMYEEKSKLDLMTEIYNNVSFQHYVTEQISTCGRSNMYLFDLDYFKSVNDTHGHVKGDEILKAFAGILRRTYDTAAIVGRMGGDEFAVFEMIMLVNIACSYYVEALGPTKIITIFSEANQDAEEDEAIVSMLADVENEDVYTLGRSRKVSLYAKRLALSLPCKDTLEFMLQFSLGRLLTTLIFEAMNEVKRTGRAA